MTKIVRSGRGEYWLIVAKRKIRDAGRASDRAQAWTGGQEYVNPRTIGEVCASQEVTAKRFAVRFH